MSDPSSIIPPSSQHSYPPGCTPNSTVRNPNEVMDTGTTAITEEIKPERKEIDATAEILIKNLQELIVRVSAAVARPNMSLRC